MPWTVRLVHITALYSYMYMYLSNVQCTAVACGVSFPLSSQLVLIHGRRQSSEPEFAANPRNDDLLLRLQTTRTPRKAAGGRACKLKSMGTAL